MSRFIPNPSLFPTLRSKVIVLAGGSTGIGAATVSLLSQHGAHIYFGDVDDESGAKLKKSLLSGRTQGSRNNGGVTTESRLEYHHTDVREPIHTYNLFKAAFAEHGRVDHAICCAGILERGAFFDPELTVEELEKNLVDHDAAKVLDIDLVGNLQFARIAAVFLRDGNKDKGLDKSLTILASVNSFRESPGLYMYQVAKHGLLGILRSTRSTLWRRDGIRVNAVCPGMTESEMTKAIVPAYKDGGLFWQPASDVAELIGSLMATRKDGTAEPGTGDYGDIVTGKAIYIESGKCWEYDQAFWDTMPQWLSEEGSMMVKKNMEAVRKGSLLKR